MLRSEGNESLIKGVIFDLDGVLVDTAEYHFRAWRRLAEELGVDFTREDNERLKGVSRMESLEIILEIGGIDMDEEEKRRAAACKNGYYQEYIEEMDEGEILPGVMEVLEELRERGARTCVASASKNAPKIMAALPDLDRLFDARVYGQDLEHSKPHPQIFKLCAQRLGMDPGRCVVVEDAEAGIEAAHRAGMLAVGIGSPEHLHTAEIVARGLDELNAADLLFENATTSPDQSSATR
ncbi:MAG: beta-phosphoglucomutase [Armatimonadota bacterium]|nr:beta-phosphoglucomutase [Armatimonadota bacterium]